MKNYFILATLQGIVENITTRFTRTVNRNSKTLYHFDPFVLFTIQLKSALFYLTSSSQAGSIVFKSGRGATIQAFEILKMDSLRIK